MATRVGIVSALLASCSLLLCACTDPMATSVVASSAAVPAADMAAAVDPAQGCFVGQMPPTAWASRAAASVVEIMAIDSDSTGQGLIGTGFVVRNSGGRGDPTPRILTGLHVIQNVISKGGLVGVMSSSGVRLGYAELVTTSADGTDRMADGNRFSTGDVAVLRMRGFIDGGRQAYGAIEGVDLAPDRTARWLKGTFSTPGGVEGGTSGAPVLDRATGAAVGILLRSDKDAENEAASALWTVHVAARAGRPMAIGRGRVAMMAVTVNLPVADHAYASPIRDSHVLAALGAAGAAATLPAARQFSDVTVPGFPLQTCVAYHGSMSVP